MVIAFRPARNPDRVCQRWLGAVIAVMVMVGASLTLAPPATAEPTCSAGAPVQFDGQSYCPGTGAGVKRTAYGVGARIVLTDVTVGRIGGSTATVSICWTPGHFCGAILPEPNTVNVSLIGISTRPARGDTIDLYGITTSGSLSATGFVVKGHRDLPPPSREVSLLSRANNRYVVAENAGSASLIANRSTVGQWEKFDLVELDSGGVALRSHANNKYVAAENAGKSGLIANRTAVGLWETFVLVSNPDGTVSLRAQVNGKYVVAENAGAAPLIANRTAIGVWEKFDLTSRSCDPDFC